MLNIFSFKFYNFNFFMDYLIIKNIYVKKNIKLDKFLNENRKFF